MTAAAIDGYSLVAIIIAAAVVIIMIVVAARLIKGERAIKITRLGVFIERERFEDEEAGETNQWPHPPESG